MAKLWPIKTIGPTMPSMYTDMRIEGDRDYGLNLFKPSEDSIMNWLKKKETGSFIYVSFGSVAELKKEQMEELAFGLKGSNYHFLWVVSGSENKKLPNGFVEETTEKGLVVHSIVSASSWCCGLLHDTLWVELYNGIFKFGSAYGGNATWTDQPTNAKIAADVWEVGVRAGVDEKGIARREEIERCISEVMEGGRGIVIRRNSIRWKELTKEAVDEGGSSDRNLKEFVDRLLCT